MIILPLEPCFDIKW